MKKLAIYLLLIIFTLQVPSLGDDTNKYITKKEGKYITKKEGKYITKKEGKKISIKALLLIPLYLLL